MSEVKFSKNGYEIRSDVLAMAKDHVQNEYRAKYAGRERTIKLILAPHSLPRLYTRVP